MFSIKTAADEEKDSTAAQGLAKLNFFNTVAVLDYETCKASVPIYAVFGTAMKDMIEKPRAAQKVAFRSTAEKSFHLSSKQDRSSIYSNQVSIKVLQTSVGGLLLDGSFE